MLAQDHVVYYGMDAAWFSNILMDFSSFAWNLSVLFVVFSIMINLWKEIEQILVNTVGNHFKRKKAK